MDLHFEVELGLVMGKRIGGVGEEVEMEGEGEGIGKGERGIGMGGKRRWEEEGEEGWLGVVEGEF